MENVNPILTRYLHDLRSCKSYDDVLKYCNRTFKNVLGKGSSRKVYKIPFFDLVVKVAIKDFGVTQNKTEVSVYKRCKDKVSIISKTYDYDHKGFTWLLSEYCYVNGCDQDDNRMDSFIQSECGISGPLLRLLCTLCMSDKSLSIINKNKDDFISFTRWVKNNLKILYRKRVENKKEYRKYLFAYIEMNYPKMLEDSARNNFCLHYYFLTCLYHLRSVDIVDLFDYVFNCKYKTVKFIMDFRELTKMSGIDLLDSIDVGNMGLVKRNGKKQLVLLDYGYTELKK